MSDTEGYVVMSDQGRANVQSIIDTLEETGRKIGGWTDSLQARQTGATLTVKFDNKVDVYTTMEWAATLQQCPQKLINACERLILADTEIDRLRALVCALEDAAPSLKPTPTAGLMNGRLPNHAAHVEALKARQP